MIISALRTLSRAITGAAADLQRLAAAAEHHLAALAEGTASTPEHAEDAATREAREMGPLEILDELAAEDTVAATTDSKQLGLTYSEIRTSARAVLAERRQWMPTDMLAEEVAKHRHLSPSPQTLQTFTGACAKVFGRALALKPPALAQWKEGNSVLYGLPGWEPPAHPKQPEPSPQKAATTGAAHASAGRTSRTNRKGSAETTTAGTRPPKRR